MSLLTLNGPKLDLNEISKYLKVVHNLTSQKKVEKPFCLTCLQEQSKRFSMRLKSGKKFSKNENSSCGGLDVIHIKPV